MASGSTVLNGEQIQARLTKFVKRWEEYKGTERGEAQTFLNELFAAYGWPVSIAQDSDELVSQLLKLNEEIASGERPYAPFPAEDDGSLEIPGI